MFSLQSVRDSQNVGGEADRRREALCRQHFAPSRSGPPGERGGNSLATVRLARAKTTAKFMAAL